MRSTSEIVAKAIADAEVKRKRKAIVEYVQAGAIAIVALPVMYAMYCILWMLAQ